MHQLPHQRGRRRQPRGRPRACGRLLQRLQRVSHSCTATTSTSRVWDCNTCVHACQSTAADSTVFSPQAGSPRPPPPAWRPSVTLMPTAHTGVLMHFEVDSRIAAVCGESHLQHGLLGQLEDQEEAAAVAERLQQPHHIVVCQALQHPHLPRCRAPNLQCQEAMQSMRSITMCVSLGAHHVVVRPALEHPHLPGRICAQGR